MTDHGKREQVEGLIIEQGALGWYVIDWDMEGDCATLAGPLPKPQAVARAIDLSHGGA